MDAEIKVGFWRYANVTPEHQVNQYMIAQQILYATTPHPSLEAVKILDGMQHTLISHKTL